MAALGPLASQLKREDLARGALSVALGLVSQLSGLGLIATAAWLITTASLKPPILTLTVAIAAVRLFALLRGIGRYGERLASHDVALRALARLRVWAFRQLQPLVPGELSSAPGGDLLARIVGDVDSIQDLIVRILVPMSTGLGTAAAGVALSALLLPEAGLALGVGLTLSGIVIPYLARTAGRRSAAPLGAQRGRISALIVEALEGAADLITFGATSQTLIAVDEAEVAFGRTVHRTAGVVGAATGFSALVAGITGVAMMTLGIQAVGARDLSAVGVAVLGFVALASFESIQTLPEAYARVEGALGAARRVSALATASPPVEEPLHPGRPPSGPPALSLHHACFSYRPGGPSALDGVDLDLTPGARVALVGPSGAGKTTIAMALLRFIELGGGTATLNGVDLRSIPSDHVRSLIAWAPQEPHIFGASVAVNLRLARPDASDGKLLEVLESLGLGGWMRGLDRGLDTVLGEHGATISGGERQRLGLARALLADRPIVILDEPTAHLDRAGEMEVRQHIAACSSDRSLLWITHHLRGLDAFTEVVVLNNGQVIERGHANELMHAGGELARMMAEREFSEASDTDS